MDRVTVIPKSSKAKNRLANMMNNDAVCTVEQQHDSRMFLASSNQRYFFWVENSDKHWDIIQ